LANSIDHNRRLILKGAVSSTTLALVVSSGLLAPKRLLAHWPKDAFNAQTLEDALQVLLGETEIKSNDKVKFKVGSPPTYAVNGASVPIEIQSSLTGIEQVSVLVENNPFPLAMNFELTSETQLPLKSFIKIAEDSNVYAVIRAQGKLYSTVRFVEVDIGGCG